MNEIPKILNPGATQDEIRRTVNQLIQLEIAHHPMVAIPFSDISDALPKHETKIYNRRSLTVIKQIVIHHVGVDAQVSPLQTAKYHINKNDWPGIGYHFFITIAGEVWMTNQLETVSYHCGGECNWVSVGVCLEGSFQKKHPSDMQKEALYNLNLWLLSRLNLPSSSIKGHREVRQTACPGKTWPEWKPEVVPMVEW